MSTGRRTPQRQQALWIATTETPEAPGHPFYRRLNALLAEHGFVEALCEMFYHNHLGRPGVPPGVYLRMLLIGYFEGIDSERSIAWRCSDSRALSAFLGYGLSEATPDHSSLSRIREIFRMCLQEAALLPVVKELRRRGWVNKRRVTKKGRKLGRPLTPGPPTHGHAESEFLSVI